MRREKRMEGSGEGSYWIEGKVTRKAQFLYTKRGERNWMYVREFPVRAKEGKGIEWVRVKQTSG